MQPSFAEKTFFSRSSNCYLQTKKNGDTIIIHYTQWMQSFSPLLIRLCQKLYRKTKSIIHAGKKKKITIIPKSYPYLLTRHCNLTSVKKLKSPQIIISENTGISLCSLNTTVYTKGIQRSCRLEYLQHYQVYSLLALLSARVKVAFHNVAFFNY